MIDMSGHVPHANGAGTEPPSPAEHRVEGMPHSPLGFEPLQHCSKPVSEPEERLHSGIGGRRLLWWRGAVVVVVFRQFIKLLVELKIKRERDEKYSMRLWKYFS